MVILLYYIRGVNTVIFCLEFCHSWRIKTTYCEISGPREPRNPWKAAAVKIESLKCFCKCCQWFIIYRITGQGLDRMASGSEPSQRSVCLLVERMEGRHGKYKYLSAFFKGLNQNVQTFLTPIKKRSVFSLPLVKFQLSKLSSGFS